MSLNTWQALLGGSLKKFYTDNEIKAPTGRADPVLKWIMDEHYVPVSGNLVDIYVPYGASPVASGDMTITKAAISANTNPFGTVFELPHGNVFSGFMLDKKQIMATRDDRGAFLRALTGVFGTALEGWRRLTATALYGTGYGEICQWAAGATLAVGSNAITLPIDAIAKLVIGQTFQFTTTVFPSGTLGTSVNTITNIDETAGSMSTCTVTFTATSADVVPANSWIVLPGCRDASGNPNLPIGLGALLPTMFNRTGANWNTYIGTSLGGVNRSTFTRALAGVYYLGQSTDTYLQVLYNLLIKSRNIGSTDGGMKFIMHPYDVMLLNKSLETHITIFQGHDSKKQGVDISRGLVDFRTYFLSSYADLVLDSPFCPQGTVYMLPNDCLKFYGLVDSKKMVAGQPADNLPGKENLTAMQQPALEYKYDELESITITPTSATVDGEAIMGTLSTYGTFGLKYPGFAGVGQFGAAVVTS